MIAMAINLTITMTCLQMTTRIMHYRNLTKQFLDTVIGNANLRPLFVVLHSNIFFYVKLFEAIILSICRIV